MRIRDIGKVERDIAEHLQKFSYQQRSLPYCLDYTELLIRRIGNAYAEGQLKIPGEVIREKLRGAEHPWGVGLKVGDILIALRPGTGKEEKPEVTEDIDWLDGENYGAK